MTKKKSYVPANLKKAQAVVRQNGEHTRSEVVTVLKLSDQPLVTEEICAHLKLRGLNLSKIYVAEVLKKLAAAGEISSREETPTERVIRHGKYEPRGAHFTAMYYWAPTGKVPVRTRESSIHMSTRTAAKKTRQPAKATRVQTGSKITTRENIGLLTRVAELEKQVNEMRQLLGTK